MASHGHEVHNALEYLFFAQHDMSVVSNNLAVLVGETPDDPDTYTQRLEQGLLHANNIWSNMTLAMAYLETTTPPDGSAAFPTHPGGIDAVTHPEEAANRTLLNDYERWNQLGGIIYKLRDVNFAGGGNQLALGVLSNAHRYFVLGWSNSNKASTTLVEQIDEPPPVV